MQFCREMFGLFAADGEGDQLVGSAGATAPIVPEWCWSWGKRINNDLGKSIITLRVNRCRPMQRATWTFVLVVFGWGCPMVSTLRWLHFTILPFGQRSSLLYRQQRVEQHFCRWSPIRRISIKVRSLFLWGIFKTKTSILHSPNWNLYLVHRTSDDCHLVSIRPYLRSLCDRWTYSVS